MTRGTAQDMLNKAREAGREEPARTEKPLSVYDANQRPGGLSYSVLRSYSNVNEPARVCINRIKQMMHGLEYDVVPLEEDSPNDAEVEAGRAWFSDEGGMGRPGVAVSEFVDELVEDLLVCGCIAMYPRPSKGRKSGLPDSNIISVEPIDAATIIPLRDEKGWIPEPPAPAYKQKLKSGASAKEFTRDELIYRIWGSRTYTSYGQSFVECTMNSILQFQAADIYNLVWFTEGDAIVGYWRYTGADVPSPQEVASFRAYLERQQLRGQKKGKPVTDMMPPAGWEYVPFRPRNEADYIATQKFLYQRIAPFFGLNPSALGLESETYKASQASQQRMAVRQALVPIATWLENVFTAVLQGPLGLKSVKFNFDTELSDQGEVAKMIKTAGPTFITPNEGRELLGLVKLKGGYADDLFIITQTGVTAIASTDEKRAALIDEKDEAEADADNADNQQQPQQQPPQPQPQQAQQAAPPPQQAPGKAASSEAARDDLRRWRDKSRKSLKAGKGSDVRFVSDAIPHDIHDAISKALASGGDPGEVFGAYLSPPEHNWADFLSRGLDGMLEQLEASSD